MKILPREYGAVGLLGLIFSVVLFSVTDSSFIVGMILSVVVAYLFFKSTIRLTTGDLLIFLIYIYQIFLFFTTIGISNSLASFKGLTVSVLCYVTVRFAVYREPVIRKLLLLFCLFIACVCIVSVFAFDSFAKNIHAVGFDCLYAFRATFRPLGLLSNVWGTYCLVFWGLSAVTIWYYRANRKALLLLYVLQILITYNILVTFSRGVYVAFFVMVLLSALFLLRGKFSVLKRIGSVVLLFIPVLIILYSYKAEVAQTLKFNETLSQQRSIDGRIDAIDASFKLIHAYPLMGIGPGNFARGIHEYLNKNEDYEFTSVAPNGYSQLLSEQGIIGFLLWGLLWVSLFFPIKKGQPVQYILFILVAGMLVREATFPVFLGSGLIQMIFFIILGIAQNRYKNPIMTTHNPRVKNTLAAVAVMAGLGISGLSVYFKHAEESNSNYIEAMNDDRLEDARTAIEDTPQSTPYLINRSVLYLNIFFKTGDPSFLFRSQKNLEKINRGKLRDPMTDLNRVMIMTLSGEYAGALSLSEELLLTEPYNSIYSLNMFILQHRMKDSHSFVHLENALWLNPNILETSLWDAIRGDYPEQCANIISGLLYALEQMDIKTCNPIVAAKYGKFLYLIKQDVLSGRFFEHALNQLPNLTHPWYYWGKIEQRLNHDTRALALLKRFVYISPMSHVSPKAMDEDFRTLNIRDTTLYNDEFYRAYHVAFSAWYGSETTSWYSNMYLYYKYLHEMAERMESLQGCGDTKSEDNHIPFS